MKKFFNGIVRWYYLNCIYVHLFQISLIFIVEIRVRYNPSLSSEYLIISTISVLFIALLSILNLLSDNIIKSEGSFLLIVKVNPLHRRFSVFASKYLSSYFFIFLWVAIIGILYFNSNKMLNSIGFIFAMNLLILTNSLRALDRYLTYSDFLTPHQSKEETIYEELRTRFTSHNLINDVSNLKVYISILKQEEPQLLSKFSILEEMTLMIEDTITKFRNSDSIRTKNPFILHELFDNFLILNKPDLVREESNLQIIYQKPDYRNLEIHHIFYEVYQVLNNLISNARKAIAKTERKEIQIFTLVETEGYVVFQVSDTGIGINSKSRNRIFDIGYSTTNGDGLGLLFVQTTLKRFGGEISLLPNALSGFSTTFEVKIPFQKTI